MDMPIGQKPQCISNRAPQESHSAGALVVAQGSLWRHVCPAAKKQFAQLHDWPQSVRPYAAVSL